MDYNETLFGIFFSSNSNMPPMYQGTFIAIKASLQCEYKWRTLPFAMNSVIQVSTSIVTRVLLLQTNISVQVKCYSHGNAIHVISMVSGRFACHIPTKLAMDHVFLKVRMHSIQCLTSMYLISA